MSRSGKNLGPALHVTAQAYNSPPASLASQLSSSLKQPIRAADTYNLFVTLPDSIAAKRRFLPTSSTHRLRDRRLQLGLATQLQREAPGIAPHNTR